MEQNSVLPVSYTHLGTPTEMYTAPKTRFAAGFIGSYNIFTAAEFKKLCGEDTDAPDVAIRPEVVRLH